MARRWTPKRLSTWMILIALLAPGLLGLRQYQARRAEERATQALIAGLETKLNARLNVLLGSAGAAGSPRIVAPVVILPEPRGGR